MRNPGNFVLLVLLVLLSSCAGSPPAPDPELWLYYATNLADSAEVQRLESVWRRAAGAGYARVVVADPKFSRLGEMDEGYFENVRRVRAMAADLGLEIVPGVFPIGRSNSLLAHDPNLAEGLPIRHALFEVRGGEARLVQDPPVAFADRPDLRDPDVSLAEGRLRITPGPVRFARVRDNRRTARFMYRVAVTPYRCYRVSVRIATAGFTGTPLVQVVASGVPIHFTRTLGVRPSQGWTTHDIAFHSLDHHQVAIYFGVWGRATGSLSWRDWRIEETGPFNVLRRPGAPFEVEGPVEGRDFERVEDPSLGMSPWRGQYDAWHEPITIRTRLPDGTRFRASWYQAAVFYNGQVPCCLSEPKVMHLLADEAARVRAAFGARSYLMMHDEIRALNRDASCLRRGMSPGTILAANARDCVRLLSGAQAFVWSDMFDPFQNAVRGYHLVNGDLAGSWEGLAPEVGVVNWNAGRAGASLRFFARRGHRQVLAAYYDGRPDQVRDLLATAAGVGGVFAVMYTTWRGRYDDLEEFARQVRGIPPRRTQPRDTDSGKTLHAVHDASQVAGAGGVGHGPSSRRGSP